MTVDESFSSGEESADLTRRVFRRAIDIAQANGKMRVPPPRRRKRFTLPGEREEEALSIDDYDSSLGKQSFLPEQEKDPLAEAVPTAQVAVASSDVDPDGVLYSQRQLQKLPADRWKKAPGMAASRTKYRGIKSVGTLLTHMIRNNGWDTPSKMGTIMAKWPQIVGETVANHCVIETFENSKLVVRCNSTAWTKQLQMLLPTIERRIAEEVGAGVVTQVVILGPVARSWKKGRYSVPGRGPRDTYG